ncbi:MAG: hypothetical protein LBQ84_04895 [Flavobacteriaceae bacterium]|jgi:YD repeat-containing protein|nr:hypothetical protein [Flavobacteriaceae bacterium]
MKNLVFLTISFLCFNFFTSCGDENFEPYTYTEKRLLPSKITITTYNGAGDPIATETLILKYDNLNRLISEQTSSESSEFTRDFYYDKDGNVSKVKTQLSTSLDISDYVYLYVNANQVIEELYVNAELKETSTLDLNNGKLIKKDSPEDGITTFEYDVPGNLTGKTHDGLVLTYAYGASIGIASNVRTPQWSLLSSQGELGLTHFLVNNITLDDNGYTYQYEYETSSAYPSTVIIDGGTKVMSIMYMPIK